MIWARAFTRPIAFTKSRCDPLRNSNIALFVGAVFASATAIADDVNEPTFYDYRIVNEFPHDTTAFTQGLFIDDGVLYETTGQYGASGLRKASSRNRRNPEIGFTPRQPLW